MLELIPYLLFEDRCRDALAWYTRIGLGRVTRCLDGELLPGTGQPAVFHALFEGPGVAFFASDNDDAEAMRGFALALEVGDADEAALRFEALSSAGLVTVPLRLQSWGTTFGMVRDRFGVPWMVNSRT